MWFGWAIEEAARHDAKLIVLPEIATTGYCWQSRTEIASYVEPIPGPTTDRFQQLATQSWYEAESFFCMALYINSPQQMKFSIPTASQFYQGGRDISHPRINLSAIRCLLTAGCCFSCVPDLEKCVAMEKGGKP